VPENAAVAGLLLRLNTELRRRLQQELANESWLFEAGVRTPCVGMLKLLDKKGPISQREIADALLVDPSDLVSLLDVLEDAGFLERRRDPDDRRRNAVVLTTAGKEATDRVMELARRAEDGVLTRLTTQQRRELKGLLELAIGDE
jgi:DNA-binding MarR family transcriptional regulator